MTNNSNAREDLRGPATEDGVVIGNVYNKYKSQNPIARYLLSGFFSSFDDLLRLSGARDVHETGCGEGYLCARIKAQGCEVRGSDFSTRIVQQARDLQGDGIPFSARSVYDLEPPEDSAELVVCCEVLEHLEEPAAALGRLASVAEKWCIMSVPREPVWSYMNMARGRYWADMGNTPGHIQRWSSRGFLDLAGGYFDIVEVRRPLPWTMILCRPKNR